MTQDEIIEMARQAGAAKFYPEGQSVKEDNYLVGQKFLEAFAKLIAAAEREVLEAELLKLKKGVAANRDYIQGRWDLIGEFQDIIRSRGES